MAKKEAKVSINKLETAILPNESEFVLDDSDNVVVKVKKTLSLAEMLEFVNDVVTICIDSTTGEYAPEARDYAIRHGVIISYTNVRLPSDAAKAYDLLYRTTLYEQTIGLINNNQYKAICETIDKKIEHTRETIIANLTTEMTKLVNQMEIFTKSAEEMFGNISGESMAGLVDKLANADSINEKALVKAVFDAQKADEETEFDETTLPKFTIVEDK